MSRTFTNLLTHLIFSTKDREPLIVPEIKSELFAYLAGLTRELKGKAYVINGTADHIHMHHRKQTFKDELVDLLGKHEVHYDERYIWD